MLGALDFQSLGQGLMLEMEFSFHSFFLFHLFQQISFNPSPGELRTCTSRDVFVNSVV